MPNTSYKISIVVQSKYQDILNDFSKTYLETTKGFPNLKTYIIHKDLIIPERFISHQSLNYNAIGFNEVITKVQKDDSDLIGFLNDDLVFSDGWLEDVLDKLNKYNCVSPGYIEKEDVGLLPIAVEKTKNEEGVVEGLFGSCFFFPVRIFKKIGLFDENLSGCEDMDWMIRMKLNNLKVVTSRKITILHYGALTTKQRDDGRKTYLNQLKNKDLFIKKHGYENYHYLVKLYIEYKKYFWNIV